MEELWKKIIKNRVFKLIWSIIGIYVLMKYLVPLFFPFLLAFLLSRLLMPIIRFLNQKLRIRKGFLAAGILTILTGIFILIIWYLVIRGFDLCKYVLVHLDLYQEGLMKCVEGCGCYLEKKMGIDAGYLEKEIGNMMTDCVNHLQITWLPQIMDYSVVCLKGLGKFFGVLMITWISTVFITTDYEKIHEMIENTQYFGKILHIIKKTGATLTGFLKAQGIIFLIVAGICVGAQFLCKNPSPVLTGMVIAVLDALPFIGTAIIYVPWAVIDLFGGCLTNAVIRLCACLLTIILRQILEPKLMGDQMGILPIIMIIAIYLGIRIFGITGIVLGPVSVMLLAEYIK